MTTHFHTEIAAGPIQRAPVNTALGDLDQEIYNTQNGLSSFNFLDMATNVSNTISAGTLTPTGMVITVNAQTGTEDDLDNIGGTGQGSMLVLYAAAGDTILVKHNSGGGNIRLSDGQDLELVGNNNDCLVLFRNKTTSVWTDAQTHIKRNVAGTAAPTATDDAASGYVVGSMWFDTTNDRAYVCLDATATAAVWKLIDGHVWEEIASGDLASAAASISLTSIPATYKNLKLIMSVRGAKAATFDNLYVRFNNDSTAANYNSQYGYHQATTTAAAVNNGTLATVSYAFIDAASAPADAFSSFEMLILDYADTNKNTMVHGDSHALIVATTPTLTRWGGHWDNTAAVNRIDILAAGGNMVQHTTYQLLGQR